MLKLNKLFSFLIASSILSVGEVSARGETVNDANGRRHVGTRQARPVKGSSVALSPDKHQFQVEITDFQGDHKSLIKLSTKASGSSPFYSFADNTTYRPISTASVDRLLPGSGLDSRNVVRKVVQGLTPEGFRRPELEDGVPEELRAQRLFDMLRDAQATHLRATQQAIAQPPVSKGRPAVIARTQPTPQRKPISSARIRPIAATPQQRQRVLSTSQRERTQVVAPRVGGAGRQTQRIAPTRPLPPVRSVVGVRVRPVPARQPQVARLQAIRNPGQARPTPVVPHIARVPASVRHTPLPSAAERRAASAVVNAPVEPRPVSVPASVRHTPLPSAAKRRAATAAPQKNPTTSATTHRGAVPAAQGTLSFNELPPALQAFGREYARRSRQPLPAFYTEEQAVMAINLLNDEGHSQLAQKFVNHLNSKGIQTYTLRFRDLPPELKTALTHQARIEGAELPDDSDEMVLSPKTIKKFLTKIRTHEPRLEAPVRAWLQTTCGFVE